MFDELIESVCQKVAKKSSKAVKKEVKKKVDAATTGENGQKLLIGACVLSCAAIIFSLVSRNSKPVVINVYNNGGVK